MSGQAFDENDSVDLTEDEETQSEADTNISDESHPINFVNCATNSKNARLRLVSPPPLTSINRIISLQEQNKYKLHPTTSTPTLKRIEPKNSPHIANIIRPRQKSSQRPVLKPPITTMQESIISETGDDTSDSIETVCLDSDEEVEGLQIHPNQGRPPRSDAKHCRTVVKPINNTIIPPPSHPGKIVLIKKNNKMYKIVIPHNVIPNIRESVGPVLINIPGVGPLVISNDPQVKVPQANEPDNVQPFSLNFDEIKDASQTETVQKSSVKTVPSNIILEYHQDSEKPTQSAASLKSQNLADKKYCWTVVKNRKRDLEGFTYSDRLGFGPTEKQRTRKCSRILDSIVSKKRTDLLKQIKKYQLFKSSRKATVKLVKINDIVKKGRAEEQVSVAQTEPNINIFKQNKTRQPPPDKRSPRSRNFNTYDRQLVRLSPNQVITQNNDYDCDLLLTKKVVILREEKGNNRTVEKVTGLHKSKRQLKRERIEKIKKNRYRFKKINKNIDGKLKTRCFVQLSRDKKVEEQWIKSSINSNNLLWENQRQGQFVDYKISRKKSIDDEPKSKITNRMTKPPKTKIQNSNIGKTHGDPKEERFYENITKIFRDRIIMSEAQFRSQIFYIKPILLINEHNLGIINYSSEFSGKNLVFAVKEGRNFPKNILRNEDFISGVELGYIKLVDAELLCNYIMGSIEFTKLPDSEEYVVDHNYCVSSE